MSFLTTIPGNEADKTLLDTFLQKGDSDSLSKLYQRYMPLVYGLCLKYFKDAERSKDAVMDIYLELVAKLPKYEVANFKAWLYTLARNHCLMQLRSPKNIKTTEFSANFMQKAGNEHLEEERMEKEQDLNRLSDCLQTLPQEQQQSVALFFLQDKCYKEIAEITGFEWNKVRSYIQNGKRNLKICMEQRNEQEIPR